MEQLSAADVKAAVHEVIEEQRQNFWVEPERHYLHHKQMDECLQTKPEWAANHEFISDLREAGGIAKKTTIRAGIGTLVTAILGYMVHLFFK